MKEPTETFLALENKRKEVFSLIQRLRQDKKINPVPATEGDIVLDVLTGIPFVAGTLNRIKNASIAVKSLVTLDNSLTYRDISLPAPVGSLPLASQTFQHLGAIAAVANFLSIPLVFLASSILGKPAPLTLTRLGEWLYSGVLLGLTILPFIFPPLAPILMIVSVALGFLSSIYFLNQFIREKRQIESTLPVLQGEVELLEATIDENNRLHNEFLADLESRIPMASSEELDQDVKTLNTLQSFLDELYQQRNVLVNRKENLRQQDAVLTDANLTDKAFAFSISSILLIAIPMSIFFPPIGFIMFNTAFVAAGVYTLGRLLTPVFFALKDALMRKLGLDTTHLTGTAPTDAPVQFYKTSNPIDKPDLVEPLHEQSPLSPRKKSTVKFDVEPDKVEEKSADFKKTV